MPKDTEIVNPNLSNFIKSLRDIGYTFEIAVADILDNSISAGASDIEIFTVHEPELKLEIFDNGEGMDDESLKEAMRLASKNPEDARDKKDLGRFGLGLKTASFSQCQKLTVISKKANNTSARQWDLLHIQKVNQWELITPSKEEIKESYFYQKLQGIDSGTIVIWENIDQQKNDDYSTTIDAVSKHLSLVFHRFLEGKLGTQKINIIINNRKLKPFNPFNIAHSATQQIPEEKIKFYDENIIVKPYILPHHSKISQVEYDRYATIDGYTKSQGFYLYRANRLLIYGTWWGLHKAIDAHKLVRIQIDIPNNQDHLWGIDIKKSTAKPVPELRSNLKIIVKQVTAKGSRPYTGRGKKIEDKTTTHFWNMIPEDNVIRFVVNNEHPVYKLLKTKLQADEFELIKIYLMGLEAYIPLEAIQAQLQQNPFKIKQKELLREKDIMRLAEELKKTNLSEKELEILLKADIFKENPELFTYGNE